MLRPIIALALFALAPLGSVPAAAQQTSADAIAKLEAKRAQKPNDAGTLRSLGIAYFKNKEYAKAQAALARAAELKPKDGVTALYLGMAAEEQGDLIAARAAYTTYLARGRTKSARDEVSKKLAALAHRELQARAKATVAAEQQLAARPVAMTTLAVLPLTVNGGDDMQPLGRGLADLMISDFGKVDGLTLVERERMQAILDEIRLGQSGAVDQATAVRSGRLIQAGRVVTGTLDAPTLQAVALSGGSVNVTSGGVEGRASSVAGPIDRLFDLEKQLVVSVLRAAGLGTQKDFDEIQGNRPTRNIQAFLAYSRGLAASDQGRLDEAAQFFDNARALDPGFSAAAMRAGEARAGQAGQAVTTGQIAASVSGGAEGEVVAAAERGATTGGGATEDLGSTINRALSDVNPSTADLAGPIATLISRRDPSTSTTQQDQLTRIGVLTIVIRRP
ncbi:MAG TPA: CsgG/HfaB family protein [Gemmatimonadaceae bacterium]|nr:CsgG/HfaB family protein [Gemmatimonadaceae bacterium]